MFFAESADSGFINRSFVGFCSAWSIFDLNWCLVLPVIWVCISELVRVPVIWTRWFMHGCTNSQIKLHHDQNMHDWTLLLQEPCFVCSLLAMKVEATEAELWTCFVRVHSCSQGWPEVEFSVAVLLQAFIRSFHPPPSPLLHHCGYGWSELSVWCSPLHSQHFTTPSFGYVYLSWLVVPVICTILYLGGPAGSMHGCQTHRSNCTTIKICVIEPCCCKNHVPSAMKVEATEAELWMSYFKTFGWHACHRNQTLLIFRVEEVSLRQLGSLCGYNTSGHTDMTSDTTPLTLPLKIAYSESRSFRTPKKVINTKQALSRFWDVFRTFFSMQNN